MAGVFDDKRVAVLAPFSPQGTQGGAERLYQGLLQAVRARVGHAELIGSPADESSFDRILDNYEHWQNLDLSAFDMVISTKAPTYAVHHPCHVLYLVHTMRVFYDMFDPSAADDEKELRARRQKILDLDTRAFNRAHHRFAIGHEVAGRLRRWNRIQAEVLHPPLVTRGFHPGDAGDYFFLPGRLHDWKRVDLAIRAVRTSKMPIRLKIAGTGEAEGRLKQTAGGDPRIVFLGRVRDDDLIELYARALAVIFTPIREDYGYVTLEAFQSGKPVVTCTDSGEPLQFVRHGLTGLVCDPDPDSVREAMEALWSDPDRARSMGRKGRAAISGITWDRVADRLLEAGLGGRKIRPTREGGGKIRTTVLDMQPIDPPVGGGRLRLLGLYHDLGPDFRTRYIGTYDWPGEPFRRHRLGPNLEEIDVPLSDAHHEAASRLAEQAGGKAVVDLAFPRLCHLSPDYLEAVKTEIRQSDVVIFSHPWVFPAAAPWLGPDQLVVYDSHNVEGYLRAQLLDETRPEQAALLRDVVRAEYAAGERAHLVLCCSLEDMDLFARIYGWPLEKMRWVPNGVLTSALKPPDPAGKQTAKADVGLASDRPAAIFLGSQYPPNGEAAEFIIRRLARALPEVDFIIAGNVGAGTCAHTPGNVRVTGPLDETGRRRWLHAADLAVNPMFSGSGTNIKMFDFMAAGLPIVSTPLGARGITEGRTAGIRIATPDRFASEVRDLLSGPDLAGPGRLNRQWVERDFAWETISPQLGSILRQIPLDSMQPAPSDPAPPERPKTSPLRLAHITTAGQLCGIGEYTLNLIAHLPQDRFDHLIVTCDTSDGPPDLKDPPAEVCVAWRYDHRSFSNSRFHPDLVARLCQWGAQAVLIQYHGGFFPETLLEELVAAIRQAGMTVGVTLHNVSLCDVRVLSRLSRAAVLLFSHSQREIHAARTQGAALSYLPLGVARAVDRPVKTVDGRNWDKHPPVIATTGFLRHHKGLYNLIQAMDLLGRIFPGVELKAQCALYPSDDSTRELARCQDLISRLSLSRSIEMDTRFLPMDQVYERIAGADLAVLPYLESNEGGSATAAACLAAGLPLVVSDIPIFDELKTGAFVLQDTAPDTIAATLAALLQSPEEYARLGNAGRRYLEDHSWDRVAETLARAFMHPGHPPLTPHNSHPLDDPRQSG